VSKVSSGGPWERRGWPTLWGPPKWPSINQRAMADGAETGRSSCHGHQGSALTGALQDRVGGPSEHPGMQGAQSVLTWTGQGWLGAHPPSRTARGPVWGAAASQGVAGGLPGCILEGKRGTLRQGPPEPPMPGLSAQCRPLPAGRYVEVPRLTWGACGKERKAPQRGSRGCSGAGALQAAVEGSLWAERGN
jgi:hypothetical protein